MNISEFKSILLSFADVPGDVQFDKGSFLVSIRGEMIMGGLKTVDGQLLVLEKDKQYPIRDWVAFRLADLSTLAQKILENIPEEKDFVEPDGTYLDEGNLDDKEFKTPSIISHLDEVLRDPIVGTTKIIYLTSDAGEGKTTVINYLARKQSALFLNKKAKFIFIPIPLAGRPFLRFDDIVVASLVNKLRFRSFYYESFLELIKYDFIIPAFDGFEEMFMVGSTNEALSATGNLASNLNSSGTLLFATRKAYFENKGLNSQAKLFDSMNMTSISFQKISINRWDKMKFIEFAIKKGICEPESLFELVSNKLGNLNHPILTRPVLVNKLLSVLNECSDREQLIEKLTSTKTFFPNFVDAIIEREATTKWIDTSGEPYKPLLSMQEHYVLLSLIAEEMWLNNVDEINEQLFDLIADLYSETNNISLKIADQIKERIKSHALIISSLSGYKLYKFDHEEFKNFFLGIAISNKINKQDVFGIINIFKRGKLPNLTIDVLTEKTDKHPEAIKKLLFGLHNSISNESIVSSIKENIAGIAIKLINNIIFPEQISIDSYFFPSNCLEQASFHNILFKKCYFQETTLVNCNLDSCTFEDCSFDRIEVSKKEVSIKNTFFINNTISCVYDVDSEYSIYAPEKIIAFLLGIGFSFPEIKIIEGENDIVSMDERLQLFEKVVRKFMRSTLINENIIRLKLGGRYDYFMKEMLPELIRIGILDQAHYTGSGNQQRFRLKAKFADIDLAFKSCRGNYRKFIEYFTKNE